MSDCDYVDHGDEPVDWTSTRNSITILTLDFFCKRSTTEVPIPIPVDGNWHHVSVIRNKSQFRCLVDGDMKYDSRNGRPKKTTNLLKKYLRKMTGWKR